jgi:hypothetical protein
MKPGYRVQFGGGRALSAGLYQYDLYSKISDPTFPHMAYSSRRKKDAGGE